LTESLFKLLSIKKDHDFSNQKNGLNFAKSYSIMKRILSIIFMLALVLAYNSADAQRSQRRQQRKYRKTEQKLEELKKDGKIDNTEAAEIDSKKDRYHRTKNRAVRNGRVSDHEHRKMTRQNRRLKREVRRADD
jgi:Ni/Co efflux regulator RcnB